MVFAIYRNQPQKDAVHGVDNAILEALASSPEKKAVADLEEIVIRFVNDEQRDLLEFSPQLGTYQVRR
jgi:hypothetical protein